MTIKEYLDKAKELDDKFINRNGKLYSETVTETTDIWSNDACRGYLLYACESLNIDEKTRQALLSELRHAFDDYTTDQAEKHYCES